MPGHYFSHSHSHSLLILALDLDLAVLLLVYSRKSKQAPKLASFRQTCARANTWKVVKFPGENNTLTRMETQNARHYTHPLRASISMGNNSFFLFSVSATAHQRADGRPKGRAEATSLMIICRPCVGTLPHALPFLTRPFRIESSYSDPTPATSEVVIFGLDCGASMLSS